MVGGWWQDDGWAGCVCSRGACDGDVSQCHQQGSISFWVLGLCDACTCGVWDNAAALSNRTATRADGRTPVAQAVGDDSSVGTAIAIIGVLGLFALASAVAGLLVRNRTRAKRQRIVMNLGTTAPALCASKTSRSKATLHGGRALSTTTTTTDVHTENAIYSIPWAQGPEPDHSRDYGKGATVHDHDHGCGDYGGYGADSYVVEGGFKVPCTPGQLHSNTQLQSNMCYSSVQHNSARKGYVNDDVVQSVLHAMRLEVPRGVDVGLDGDRTRSFTDVYHTRLQHHFSPALPRTLHTATHV